MRIFVVGANGKLGQQVVVRALASGNEVTAFTRSQTSWPAHRHLFIVTGSVVDDAARVGRAIKGHDAVISALGNPLWLSGKRGPAIMTPALSNVVDAMQQEGVPRLAVALSWGSGASWRAASPLVRTVITTLIRRDFADFSRAEEVIVQSRLDWTVAYFGHLTNKVQRESGPLQATYALRTTWRYLAPL